MVEDRVEDGELKNSDHDEILDAARSMVHTLVRPERIEKELFEKEQRGLKSIKNGQKGKITDH